MRRDGLTSGSSLSSSPSSHPVPLFTVFQGGQVLRGLLSSPLAPTHWARGGRDWGLSRPCRPRPTPLSPGATAGLVADVELRRTSK